MNDNGITRVYQFLRTNYNNVDDWKKDADKNNDGTVIKSEFRAFMLEEFDWETGDNEDDIINKFWASIDSNTSGKVGMTKISNKNALDEKELAFAEKALEASEKINEFVSKQQVPGGINDRAGWQDSVKESLLNKALEFLRNKENASLDDWDIEKAYQTTYRQTTADYIARETIEKLLADKAEGYKVGDDKQLKKIIDNYVKSLANDETTSIETIVSEVKSLVTAYADTAETNSQSSINTITPWGYNENGKLNDLQKAVLTNQIKGAITDKLTMDSNYSALYESYGDMINAKIAPFAEKQLNSIKAADFANVDINEIVNKFLTDEVTNIQLEFTKFNESKARLKEYLNDKYIETYKDALISVFGSDIKSTVEATIDAYKTQAEVEEAENAIKAAIKAIDDAIATRAEADKAAAEAAKQKAIDAINPENMSDVKIGGTFSMDSEWDNKKPMTVNLKDAYNGNYIYELSNWKGDGSTVQNVAKANMKKLLDIIKDACKQNANCDITALETAYQKTKKLYDNIIEHKWDNSRTGRQSGNTMAYDYEGEQYTYYSKSYKYESSAKGFDQAYSQGGIENATGIQWDYSYNKDDTSCYYVNVKCVMDIFAKFYKQALGV